MARFVAVRKSGTKCSTFGSTPGAASTCSTIEAGPPIWKNTIPMSAIAPNIASPNWKKSVTTTPQ